MSPRKLIRTVRFHELGGPEVLTIDSLASPSLQATGVRIAVKVVGINRADAMFRRGSYIEKADFPSRIGYEASGIVIEVGEEVNHLRLSISLTINQHAKLAMASFSLLPIRQILDRYSNQRIPSHHLQPPYI